MSTSVNITNKCKKCKHHESVFEAVPYVVTQDNGSKSCYTQFIIECKCGMSVKIVNDVMFKTYGGIDPYVKAVSNLSDCRQLEGNWISNVSFPTPKIEKKIK